MSRIVELREELKRKADKDRARVLQRFFKTGKGECMGRGMYFWELQSPRREK